MSELHPHRPRPSAMGDDETVELPLMPMLDMVFILLIFIMVSVHFAEISNFLELDLPALAEAGVSRPSELDLHLDARGKMYLAGKALEAADLRKLAREGRFRAKTVTLVADRQTPFGAAALALSILRAGECKKIHIAGVPTP